MQQQFNNKPNDLNLSIVNHPATDCIEFFDKDHFKFFSAKTHVFSGIIGLSARHETYEYNDYTKGITGALNHLGLVTFTDIENIWLNGEKINYSIENNIQFVNLIQKLYPASKEIDREQILEFYKHPISLRFSLFKTEYLIQPIILYDEINDHYYIHWEFGTKAGFENPHPNYLFHLNGNGCNQAGQFIQAAQLIDLTSTIQILIDYPNKGLNHILNPLLRAYKTSIEGSINPHIATYNHLINKHSINGFNLTIYAYSYGNLASAKFIPLILLKNPQLQINYIGIGVPATLHQVAKSYSNNNAMWLADTFHLLNESDVYNALKLMNIKSLIFNNFSDNVIIESAQIQHHPEYIENNDQLKVIKIIEIKDTLSQHEQPLGHRIVLPNNDQCDFNTLFALEYNNFFIKK